MEKIKLNNGVFIPALANGPGIPKLLSKYVPYNNLLQKVYNKFIIRPIKQNEYTNKVAYSFKIGYTLLDNSATYNNNKLIAKAIKRSGISRSELFLTTRVSNTAQYTNSVREEFFKTLKELDTDYIDLLQFHWPVTNRYLETWKQMEQLYEEGYCKAIGVANCNIHHLQAIESISKITPTVNQVEVHPLFTQKPLIEYCKSKNIIVEAYTPIARFDDRLTKLPLLKLMAAKYKKSIPQIILRWHLQNGVIPVIRSMNKKRQLENISIFDFELTEEDLKKIDSVNINSRLRFDPDNCDFTVL